MELIEAFINQQQLILYKQIQQRTGTNLLMGSYTIESLTGTWAHARELLFQSLALDSLLSALKKNYYASQEELIEIYQSWLKEKCLDEKRTNEQLFPNSMLFFHNSVLSHLNKLFRISHGSCKTKEIEESFIMVEYVEKPFAWPK